jgi:dipeptidyl aminopeptidase/acylaminoacyl peptidase
VQIWDAADGNCLHTLAGHGDLVFSVAFSPNGQKIVSGCADGTVKVWDASIGREIFTVDGYPESGRSIVFTPNGHRLVSAEADGFVRVWDAVTRRLILEIPGRAKGFSEIAVSPDGRLIASAGEDRDVKVWDAVTGHEIHSLGDHRSEVFCVEFYAHGGRLASSGRDGEVIVWDLSSGHELSRLQVTSEGNLTDLAISPGGRRLAVSSSSGELKIFNAEFGEELLALEGHKKSVRDVEFSPDGRRIAGACSDGSRGDMHIWQVPTEEDIRDWVIEQLAAEKEEVKSMERRRKDAERRSLARLSDEGALKSWLVLAPITLGEPQANSRSYESVLKEQVADEANLHPTEGAVVRVNSDVLVWKRARFDDGIIDFDKHLGWTCTHSVSYAVCYVRMRAAKSGVVMHVDSDDSSRVYVNSRLINEFARGRLHGLHPDTVAEVTLKAGVNIVVFKIANGEGQWKGSLWFVDGDGNPLDGLSVTLDPNELHD